jgi:hypothetical protein
LKIRLGLLICGKYLASLRLDEDLTLAQSNKKSIEASQLQIDELRAKIGKGGENEGKA